VNLIQRFNERRGDIFEPHHLLTAMVFQELCGLRAVFKRDQLPSHGAVNITADHIMGFTGVNKRHIIVFGDINRRNVRYVFSGIISVEIEVIFE